MHIFPSSVNYIFDSLVSLSSSFLAHLGLKIRDEIKTSVKLSIGEKGTSSCCFLPCLAIPGVFEFILFHPLPGSFHSGAPFCPFLHYFSQMEQRPLQV